jgi:hypothetical protein
MTAMKCLNCEGTNLQVEVDFIVTATIDLGPKGQYDLEAAVNAGNQKLTNCGGLATELVDSCVIYCSDCGHYMLIAEEDESNFPVEQVQYMVLRGTQKK